MDFIPAFIIAGLCFGIGWTARWAWQSKQKNRRNYSFFPWDRDAR